MVKIRTEREISLITESNRIVAETLDMLSENIKPGIKTSDLDKLAEEFIISKGARPAFKGYMGFPSTLCISIDDSDAANKPLQPTEGRGCRLLRYSRVLL